MVGTEGGRSVVFNAESGLIAVRAKPRELRDVQQFLDKIQQIATRQVIIEAKIVEVKLSSAFQAGINWAAIAQERRQHHQRLSDRPAKWIRQQQSAALESALGTR